MSDRNANLGERLKLKEENHEKGQQKRRNGVFMMKPIDLSELGDGGKK